MRLLSHYKIDVVLVEPEAAFVSCPMSNLVLGGYRAMTDITRARDTALRRQLEAMPDGGVFAIVIPEAPYRCPPGPHERASLIAAYFRVAKPRSKVLVLDANGHVTRKGLLFKKAWADLHKGRVEYRPMAKATSVDAATNTVRFESPMTCCRGTSPSLHPWSAAGDHHRRQLSATVGPASARR